MSHDRVTVNGICFQVKPDVMADGQPYIWFTAFTEDSFARGPLMSCNANSPEGSLHRDVWDAYQAARTTTMQISQPRVATRTRVSVDVAGAEPLYSPEVDACVDPVLLTVHYSYKVSVSADGWAHHTWATTRIHVEGEGSEVCWVWYFNPDGAVREGAPMPAWLAELVDRLRPSGEVSLPRVKGL